MSSIPERVVQFWHDPEALPVPLQAAIDNTRRRNPDMEFALVGDDFVLGLLEQDYSPDVCELYRAVRIASVRSDLARYLLLYHYGGFYLDVSMEFFEPLKNIFDFDSEIVFIRRDDLPKYRHAPESAHFISGIIGVQLHHPLMKQLLDVIVGHLLSGRYNFSVSEAAGPMMLNQVVSQFSAENPGFLPEKYSFRTLLRAKRLRYHRYPGLSNQWFEQQKAGILDEEFLAGLKSM